MTAIRAGSEAGEELMGRLVAALLGSLERPSSAGPVSRHPRPVDVTPIEQDVFSFDLLTP